jgi:hypothetical protein
MSTVRRRSRIQLSGTLPLFCIVLYGMVCMCVSSSIHFSLSSIYNFQHSHKD